MSSLLRMLRSIIDGSHDGVPALDLSAAIVAAEGELRAARHRVVSPDVRRRRHSVRRLGRGPNPRKRMGSAGACEVRESTSFTNRIGVSMTKHVYPLISGAVEDANDQSTSLSLHSHDSIERSSRMRSIPTYLYSVVREIFKVAQISSTLIELSRKSFCARTTLGAFGLSGRQPPLRPHARAAARPVLVRS